MSVASYSYQLSTCMAAMYNFQNPICPVALCHLLPHAFLPRAQQM